MKTDVVTPHEVFFNPARLVVPLFQRPYVWSREEQWEPLWEDIVRLIEVIDKHEAEATHFLGAIVVQSVQSGLGSLPVWNVIDGQQRLTTLQLLLDALHAQLEERGMTTLADQLKNLVENPAEFCESPEDKFKLWPTNRDRPGFMSVMSAPVPVNYASITKSRLGDAHAYFTEAIAAWLDEAGDATRRARMLVPAIKDRLEIASIRLDAAEDAQEIFETLNARGTPLSAADLIKNFVFQRYAGTDAEAETAYLKYWAEFETPFWEHKITTGRVTHTRSSLFMWQWLTARTLEDFPIREVFTQFKFYVATQAPDISQLLPQIKASADRYREIVEGAQKKVGELTRTELFAYRMGTLDSEIARPLLIWLDEPEQADVPASDRDQLLGILESWFVRRALVRAQSQGSNRFMIDLLKHLSEQPKDALPDAAERYLASNHTALGFWPGDDEVRAILRDIEAYWRYLKGRLRMVLEALEDHKRGYPSGKKLALGPVVRGAGTIEHLMPQNWGKTWVADLDEQQEAQRNSLVQHLGNLTLVTQALNSKVSNGPWEQKRRHFLDYDDVLITKDALAIGGETWDEAAIRTRTDQMIDQILAIWPAPPGHVGIGGRAAEVKEGPTSVDLAQLVAAGWIESGTVLRATYANHTGTTAVVSQDGRVFIGDVAYDTPSAAGRWVNGVETNGWVFWAIDETSETLAKVRSNYLASLGEEEAAAEDQSVAEVVDGGATPAQLADELGITPRTIRHYLREAFADAHDPSAPWALTDDQAAQVRRHFSSFDGGDG